MSQCIGSVTKHANECSANQLGAMEVVNLALAISVLSQMPNASQYVALTNKHQSVRTS